MRNYFVIHSELAEQLEAARSAAESLGAERDALASEKASLVPALEAAKWQGRQLEKKLREATANRGEEAEVGLVAAWRVHGRGFGGAAGRTASQGARLCSR